MNYDITNDYDDVSSTFPSYEYDIDQSLTDCAPLCSQDTV